MQYRMSQHINILHGLIGYIAALDILYTLKLNQMLKYSRMQSITKPKLSLVSKNSIVHSMFSLSTHVVKISN